MVWKCELHFRICSTVIPIVQTCRQHDCTISERLQKAKWKCCTEQHWTVTVLWAKPDCMICKTPQYWRITVDCKKKVRPIGNVRRTMIQCGNTNQMSGNARLLSLFETIFCWGKQSKPNLSNTKVNAFNTLQTTTKKAWSYWTRLTYMLFERRGEIIISNKVLNTSTSQKIVNYR